MYSRHTMYKYHIKCIINVIFIFTLNLSGKNKSMVKCCDHGQWRKTNLSVRRRTWAEAEGSTEKTVWQNPRTGKPNSYITEVDCECKKSLKMVVFFLICVCLLPYRLTKNKCFSLNWRRLKQENEKGKGKLKIYKSWFQELTVVIFTLLLKWMLQKVPTLQTLPLILQGDMIGSCIRRSFHLNRDL